LFQDVASASNFPKLSTMPPAQNTSA